MPGTRPLDDIEILERIKEGDRRVLLELYNRNRQNVNNFLRQNNGSVADLEDVLQEAVIAIWQQAQRPDFKLTAKLDTLVYSIARNQWLKELRRRKKLVSEPGLNEAADQEPDINREKEVSGILLKYVKMLSDSCREILYLFYFDNLEMEQIALRLNFANADTVKAKKYQCKKKLEELIKKDFNFEDLL